MKIKYTYTLNDSQESWRIHDDIFFNKIPGGYLWFSRITFIVKYLRLCDENGKNILNLKINP